MYRIFFRPLLLVVFPLFSTCPCTSQGLPTAEYIYTVPIVKTQLTTDARTRWWHEFLEWPVNDSLFHTLLDRVDNGNIPVYQAVYPFNKPLTKEQVAQALHPKVFEEEVDVNTGEIVTVTIPNDLHAEAITSITFYEEWMVDPVHFTFTKNVKGFTLNRDSVDNMGEPWGLRPLFFVACNGYNGNWGSASVVPSPVKTPAITFDLRLGDSLADTPKEQEEQRNFSGMMQALDKAAAGGALFDTLYPYLSKVNPAVLPSVNVALSGADALRFYESWEFDVNRLTFTKQVDGAVFEKSKGNARHQIAFLPFNGFVSKPVLSNHSFNLPSFCYDVSFQPSSVPLITHTDSLRIRSMGFDLLDHARNYELPLFPGNYMSIWDYDPWNYNVPKNKAETDQLFTWQDSVLEQTEMDYDPRPVARTVYRSFGDLAGYGFWESWHFDPSAMTFEKKVKAISLQFPKGELGGQSMTMFPLFFAELPMADASIAQYRYEIGKNIQYSLFIDRSDVGGDITIYYELGWTENIYPSTRYQFVQGVIENVCNGTMTAMDPGQPGRTLPKEEVRKRINALKDSLFPKADIPVDYSLVNTLDFDEDWFYDPSTLHFYKRVNSITFSHRVTRNTETGTSVEETKLFTLVVNRTSPTSSSKK